MDEQIKNENNTSTKTEYSVNNSNLSNDSYTISLDSIPKKKKRLPIMLVSIAVILVVIGCIGYFNDTVNNFISMQLLSPEKYLSKVEAKDSAKKYNEADKHLKLLNNYVCTDGTSKPFSFEFQISDSVKALADSYIKKITSNNQTLNTMLSELIKKSNSVLVEGSLSNKDTIISLTLDFKLSTDEIIKANTIVSFDDNKIYIQIPTLSKKWLSCKITTKDVPNLSKIMGPLDTDKIKNIMKKYDNYLIGNLKNVTREKGNTLQIDKINESCTLLESKFSPNDAKSWMTDLLNKLKDDNDVKELFVSSGLVKNDDEYTNKLDESIKLLDSKDSLKGDELKYSYKTWVDLQGDILGSELKANGVSIGYKEVSNDKNSEYIYYVSSNDFSFNCEGNYETKDDVKSGSAKVTLKDTKSNLGIKNNKYLDSIDKEKEFTVDITYNDLKVDDNGLVDGNISVSSDDLASCEINMDLATNDGEQSVTAKIKALSTFEIGTIIYKSSCTNCDKIDKPNNSDTIDMLTPSASTDYLLTINITELTNNVKKAINNDQISATIDTLLKTTGLNKLNGKQNKKTVEDIQKLMIK